MRRLRLFGRDILIGKRLFGIGREEDYFGMMNQHYGSDINLQNKLEAYKGIVYACVNLIGESMAGGYEPIFSRRHGDQWEDVGDHELLRLLNNPGGKDLKATSFSMYDLVQATASFLELQGECFWYMARGVTTGRPREIIILRPDKVGIAIDKTTGDVTGYFLRRSMGDPVPFEVEEILHFKDFNPKNPYHGHSRLDAAEDYIGTDANATKFTRNFFANNAGINGVMTVKGEVSKEAFKKYVRAWRDKYEGVDNAGKVAIVRESDIEFTKVGLGLDQLDMTALRKMSKDDVTMMWRVPMPLLGKAEETGLGRGNVETLEYIFSKYVIDPKMRRFDDVLQFALRRYYKEDLRVTHKSIIPVDKEYELAVRDKAVDRWLTRDEIRDMLGLDPVPGGNELRAPLASYPIGEDTPTDGATKSLGTGIVIKRVKRITTKKKKVTKDEELDIERKENFRLSIMRIQALYEKRYDKKVGTLLESQRKSIVSKINPKALEKDFDGLLFDEGEETDKFVEKLAKLGIQLVEQVGPLALAFAGDDESTFLITDAITEAVERGTRKMAKNFNDETLAALNKSLAEGVAAGESLGKLASRVNDVYQEAKGYRAERIARTETLKASNAATTEGYRQTGYVTAKEWYVNPDACPQCLEFEGKQIGLDETFLPVGASYTYSDDEGNEHSVENTYDDIDEPPLHPNCGCTILPVR